MKLPDDMRVGVVTDPNDVRLKVNYLFQHGADSIKLIATGAVLAEGTEVGQQELSEDEMRAAVQTAAPTAAGSPPTPTAPRASSRPCAPA